jgi:hypothetical protein
MTVPAIYESNKESEVVGSWYHARLDCKKLTKGRTRGRVAFANDPLLIKEGLMRCSECWTPRGYEFHLEDWPSN